MTFNINFKIKKSMLNKNRKKTVPKKTTETRPKTINPRKNLFKEIIWKKEQTPETDYTYLLPKWIYLNFQEIEHAWNLLFLHIWPFCA